MMIDDRRSVILLAGLFIGPMLLAHSAGPLIGLLLFNALALAFILLPNQAEKRKRDE